MIFTASTPLGSSKHLTMEAWVEAVKLALLDKWRTVISAHAIDHSANRMFRMGFSPRGMAFTRLTVYEIIPEFDPRIGLRTLACTDMPNDMVMAGINSGYLGNSRPDCILKLVA